MQGGEQQVDMKMLEQLMLQELQAQQAAALAQAQQPQSPVAGQMTPQVIAQIRHQMSLPLATRPRQQVPQRDNRPLWIAAIAGGLSSATILGLAAIVSGSLAGNRGTAELNTAVIALSDTAKAVSESATRPNVTCISFNCGGMRQSGQQQDSAPAIAPPAVAQPVSEGDVYARHFESGKQEAPYVYQGWNSAQIVEEIARLQQVKSVPGITPDRAGRIDGFLSYLGGM